MAFATCNRSVPMLSFFGVDTKSGRTRRILEHLHLWDLPARPPPAPLLWSKTRCPHRALEPKPLLFGRARRRSFRRRRSRLMPNKWSLAEGKRLVRRRETARERSPQGGVAFVPGLLPAPPDGASLRQEHGASVNRPSLEAEPQVTRWIGCQCRPRCGSVLETRSTPE